MRNHQSYPADHAGNRHAGGGHQRRADHRQQTQPAGVHAHRARLVLSGRQDIEPPAHQQQRRAAQRHGNKSKAHIAHARARKAAHQPIGDGGQLVAGIGHQFDIGGSRRKKGGDHHACQQDIDRPAAARAAANQIDQRHCEQAERKGRYHNHRPAAIQQDGQRRAEARARGRAQNIRGSHGILEHALVACSRHGQAAAHHAHQQDTRQTHVEHGDFHVFRPAGFDREYA